MIVVLGRTEGLERSKIALGTEGGENHPGVHIAEMVGVGKVEDMPDFELEVGL